MSGSLFNESIDNVVLTPEQAAAVPEPSSFILLGLAVLGASSILQRRHSRSAV